MPPPIGPSLASAVHRSGRGCGWQQRGQHGKTRLWVCGQCVERCPYTHRRSISRSNQILRLLKAVTEHPKVAAKAFSAFAGPDAPHIVKSRRMTRFHRGRPCRPCSGTEQEQSGHFTSYKNRTG